jgi:hypothetical protein
LQKNVASDHTDYLANILPANFVSGRIITEHPSICSGCYGESSANVFNRMNHEKTQQPRWRFKLEEICTQILVQDDLDLGGGSVPPHLPPTEPGSVPTKMYHETYSSQK